jgi:thioredoxin reductase (NADPH)
VLAKDLVRSLAEQAAQFKQPVHLLHKVLGLEEHDGRFTLVTDKERFESRALVIAAGIGAFSPRRLPQACAQPWYGRGVYDVVTDPEIFRGQRVLIIGGGDSAFDWGTQLLPRASRVTIIHRSDRFRAHAATVSQYQAAVSAAPRTCSRSTSSTTFAAHRSGALLHVSLRDVKAKTTREIEIDVVLPMLGFVSDIGPLAEWGLTLEKEEIVVTSTMETGRPGSTRRATSRRIPASSS